MSTQQDEFEPAAEIAPFCPVQDRRTRSNCPVDVSETTTAGPGPMSVTAAPTPTALLMAPCWSMRKTHEAGTGGEACGHDGVSPAWTSTSGPAAESTTLDVTVPL